MLSYSLRVVPPTESDKSLTDYSGIIDRNLTTLFQAGHVHVGKKGVFSTFPTASDGAVGDIVMAVVSGSAYLCFKVSGTAWFRLGPGTAI